MGIFTFVILNISLHLFFTWQSWASILLCSVVYLKIVRKHFDRLSGGSTTELMQSMESVHRVVQSGGRGCFTLRCSSWGCGPPPPSMSKRTLLKRATAYCCSYRCPKSPITSPVLAETHRHTHTVRTVEALFKKCSILCS